MNVAAARRSVFVIDYRTPLRDKHHRLVTNTTGTLSLPVATLLHIRQPRPPPDVRQVFRAHYFDNSDAGGS